MTAGPPVSATARFDAKRVYRYRLVRRWDSTRPAVAWIMLNPSTATATVDDPTIRRVVCFSRDWGFGSVDVVNLFAQRATHPGELRESPAPVGPGNDEAIVSAVSSADVVMAAWGNHGRLPNPVTGLSRAGEVLELIGNGVVPLRCLGATRQHQPRHPLYMPAVSRPVEFPAG